MNQIVWAVSQGFQQPEFLRDGCDDNEDTIDRPARRVGSTAIIDIIGPISRHAGYFSFLGGADTETILAQAIDADNDPGVDLIVFNIDSPGGDARGMFEASRIIRSLDTPTQAWVESNAASAAYLYAASCDSITCSDAAYVGSIGSIISFSTLKIDGLVNHKYVSSVSPQKGLEPGDDGFDEKMQKIVDETGQAFVDELSAITGKSADEIINSFGGGDLLSSRDALSVGMISAVGSLKDIVIPTNAKGTNMTLDEFKTQHPDLHAKIVASATDIAVKASDADKKTAYQGAYHEGQKCEAKRISDIDDLAISGHEKLIEKCKDDFTVSAGDVAVMLLKAEKAAQASAATALTNDLVPPLVIAPVVEGSEWDSNAELRAEFGGDKDCYEAYAKSVKAGTSQILGVK